MFQKIYTFYVDLMDKKSDQRVKNWFLMSSPLPTLLICLTYVIIVKKLGPYLMRHRKPFELKGILIYYNLFQVLFSSWLFYEASMAGWLTHYSLTCQPVDYSPTPFAMRMVYGCWWYYISKFTEFFDTFFFVLRKKFDHITTLHVIHHGIMPMSVWFGVKFTPGGHSTFFGFLNTFVHIIMYTYYLMAALGPRYQRYLWWKRYLTAIQMVQFILVMVHAFQLLFSDCDYPRAFVWWIGMHAALFYVLFSQFYKETYKKPQSNGQNGAGALLRSDKKVRRSPLGQQLCFIQQSELFDTSSTSSLDDNCAIKDTLPHDVKKRIFLTTTNNVNNNNINR